MNEYEVRPAIWRERGFNGRYACWKCGLELVQAAVLRHSVLEPSGDGGLIEVQTGDDDLHISCGPGWKLTGYGHWSWAGRARRSYLADRRLVDHADDASLRDRARERLKTGRSMRFSAAVARPFDGSPIHTRQQVTLPTKFFCRCGGRNEMGAVKLDGPQRRAVRSL